MVLVYIYVPYKHTHTHRDAIIIIKLSRPRDAAAYLPNIPFNPIPACDGRKHLLVGALGTGRESDAIKVQRRCSHI